MSTTVISIPADACVAEAAEVMDRAGLSFLPIVREGRVVGVVTATDIATRAAARRWSLDAAGIMSVMSSPPIFLTAETEVEEAVEFMRQRRIRRILVLGTDGGLAGVVSVADFITVAPTQSPAMAESASTEEADGADVVEAVLIPGLYLG